MSKSREANWVRPISKIAEWKLDRKSSDRHKHPKLWVRAPIAKIAAWKESAVAAGQTLTAWVIEALDKKSQTGTKRNT